MSEQCEGCKDMDWRDEDMSKEHHSQCPTLRLLPGLADTIPAPMVIMGYKARDFSQYIKTGPDMEAGRDEDKFVALYNTAVRNCLSLGDLLNLPAKYLAMLVDESSRPVVDTSDKQFYLECLDCGYQSFDAESIKASRHYGVFCPRVDRHPDYERLMILKSERW